jgi:hypothetical protein
VPVYRPRTGKLGIRGAFMPTGGYQARRPPAHAGRLRSWERVTITVVFVLVAAAITAIMVLTARPQGAAPTGHRHGHGTEQPRPGGDERR